MSSTPSQSTGNPVKKKRKTSKSAIRKRAKGSRGRKRRTGNAMEMVGSDLFDDDLDELPFLDDELLSLEEFEAITGPAVLPDPEEERTRKVKEKEFAVSVPHRRVQKVRRRRQIDPTTCERDYSNDEIEFMNALDDYKRNSGRMFPTCSEVLEVLRSLGYEKTLPTPPEATEEQAAAVACEAMTVENH